MGCQKGKEELQDFMGSRDGIMIEKDAYFLEHLEEAIQQGISRFIISRLSVH